MLFEDASSGEHPERGPFHSIWGTDQHFAVAFEIGAGDTTVNALSERDGAVAEPYVNVFPVEWCFADFIDPLRIQSNTSE